MGDRYRIRNATREDLAAVAAIERAAFSDPWPESAFVPLLGPLGWVAVADDRIVGYVFARLVEDEGEILNVAVHSPYRRHGIGARLVRWALGHLAVNRAVAAYLEVRVSNTAAREMYAKLGFHPVGKRAGYYRQPREDAIVLRRLLADRDEGASD